MFKLNCVDVFVLDGRMYENLLQGDWNPTDFKASDLKRGRIFRPYCSFAYDNFQKQFYLGHLYCITLINKEGKKLAWQNVTHEEACRLISVNEDQVYNGDVEYLQIYNMNDGLTFNVFEQFMKLPEITQEEANRIAENYKPYGQYWLKAGNGYTGIDNSDGKAWTENFDNLTDLVKWMFDDGSEGEEKEVNQLVEGFQQPTTFSVSFRKSINIKSLLEENDIEATAENVARLRAYLAKNLLNNIKEHINSELDYFARDCKDEWMNQEEVSITGYVPFNNNDIKYMAIDYDGVEVIANVFELSDSHEAKAEMNFNLIEIELETSPFDTKERRERFKSNHIGYVVEVEKGKIDRINLLVLGLGWGETDIVSSDTDEYAFVELILREAGALSEIPSTDKNSKADVPNEEKKPRVFAPFNFDKEIDVTVEYDGKTVEATLGEWRDCIPKAHNCINRIVIYTFYSPFATTERQTKYNGKQIGYMVDIDDGVIQAVYLEIDGTRWDKTEKVEVGTEEYYFVEYLLREAGALRVNTLSEKYHCLNCGEYFNQIDKSVCPNYGEHDSVEDNLK
jgi:hypothetical protein